MSAFKATDIPKLLFGGLFDAPITADKDDKSSEVKNPPASVSSKVASDQIAEHPSEGPPGRMHRTDQSISNQLTPILSGVPEPIVVLDLHKNIISFNQAAEQLIGYKTSDIIGKPINKLIRLYKNDDEVLDTIYAHPSYTGNGLILVSGKTISEKSSLSVNVVSNPVVNGENLGVGCVLTFYNLTEERKTEEMKMNFVSVAAHELRTPLTSIKGYLSVFIEENELKLGSDQKSMLQQMQINVDRLEVLVENLLNVSRIERGTVSIALEQIDLSALIKQAVEEFRGRALVKNINLSFKEPEKPLPKVKVDKVRILEVIANLITNAINYTNPHGEVNITLEQKGKEAITHVTDTGVGIPQEAIPQLFTKFFRVTQGLTQNQNPQGTGLGLFVSKSIVELHHGKIWVDSELGKGSTFSFSLPVS